MLRTMEGVQFFLQIARHTPQPDTVLCGRKGGDYQCHLVNDGGRREGNKMLKESLKKRRHLVR